MARSAAGKALLAADTLDTFLQDYPRPRPQTGTGNAELPEPTRPAPGAAAPERPQPRRRAGEPHPAHPDWLHHHLTVSGTAAAVAAFRALACGAGTVPWHLDLDTLEEDWFHLLATSASREISLAAAHILAAQLRGAVERRQAAATALVGRSRNCPLDLHALVPVPDHVLRLGPDHPSALAWLWQHWGTTEALRHVTAMPPEDAKENGGEDVLRLGFWSADWTPWRAFQQMRSDFPALCFHVQPIYTGG